MNAANAPRTAPTQHAAVGYADGGNRDFPIGSKVVLVDTLHAYAEFKGMEAVVQRTVKERNWFICIRFEDETVRNAVRQLNQRSKSGFGFLLLGELDLMVCRVGQLKLVPLQQAKAGSEMQVKPLLGKRETPEVSSAHDMSIAAILD